MGNKGLFIADEMFYFRVYNDILKDDFGLEVEEATLADEGLEACRRRKFDLILMRDVVAPGSLPLPFALTNMAYPRVARHLIREIKRDSLNRETPLIAMVNSQGEYVRPEHYKEAGAIVYESFARGLEGFSDLVRSCLKK